MNVCSFIGKIAYDPELKPVGQTQKLVLRLGISKWFKKSSTGETGYKTVWADFELWDTAAKTVAEHFKKGDFIVITDASLEQDEWEDKNDGSKRSRLYFRVNRWDFLPKNGGNGNGGGEHQESAPAQPAKRAYTKKTDKAVNAPPVVVNSKTEEDIPF